MAGGRLSDRITVQRKVKGTVRPGVVAERWADLELEAGVPVQLWADFAEQPGGESLVAGRDEAVRLAKVLINDGPSARQITAADRLVARGAVWKIRSTPARSRERANVLEMSCEEWVKAPDWEG
ncbi:head-tail adaptor protein [Salipiger bermudensis]|uniref:phage head completion protein n=1 Tax=Salipiger bermudensis TaxID=344736 RepID=UPI00300A1932